MRTIEIKEIFKYLPHRYPFLLVDRVTDIVPGESIRGYKNVTINEPFFNGHFPGQPVMPGLLVVEAMAQLAAILAFISSNRREGDGLIYYLAGTDNTRFRRPVVPGDRLDMEAIHVASKQRLMKINGKATVDGELACSSEIMCVEKAL